MAAFIGGLKQSLKFDEMTSGVASKLNSAKTFIQEKQHSVSEIGAIRTIKEKVGHISAFSPGVWSKHFPGAQGNKQSPVNIVTSEVKFDELLLNSQFYFNYNPQDVCEVTNLGCTVQIVLSDQSDSSNEGLMADTYRLIQAHFHWGSSAHDGSEHTIGGLGYAGEIHLVHINTKYPSFEEALKHQDGMAVVAIFLSEGIDNPNLEPLIRLFDKITYKGDSTPLSYGFDLRKLIPDKLDFYTYEGSLTTPPCSEAVIWTVFRYPVPISSNQLAYFRRLYAVGAEDAERNPQGLVNNVRTTQPLNGRTIRSNFQ